MSENMDNIKNPQEEVAEEVTNNEVIESIDEDTEEYVKVEIDSVTEEDENGEKIELLDENASKKKSVFKEILDWVVSIAVALLVVMVLHMFVFVQVNVSGPSMDPTQ